MSEEGFHIESADDGVTMRRDLSWWERALWHIPLLRKIVIRRLLTLRGRFKQDRTNT